MYKTFDPTKDITYNDREVYTYAPKSGSVFESGTYMPDNKTFWRFYPNQVKSGSLFSGSFFCTVYDRIITNSDAVELFDLSFGISTGSAIYADTTFVKDAKNRQYKKYAEMCWGSPTERFSIDSTYYDELIFLHFKRNIIKDEIRKGYNVLYTVFAEEVGSTGSVFQYAINDEDARLSWYEAEGGTWQYLTGSQGPAGWIFYDLGLLVLTPTGTWGFNDDYGDFSGSVQINTYGAAIISANIDQICTCAFQKMDVVNYTHPILTYAEQTIHSSLYFCTAGPLEFNYSSNPTYVDSEGRIIMTSGSKPTKAASYITTIGMYGPNNELLGVAKLSEPIKKSSDSSDVFRVRVNY